MAVVYCTSSSTDCNSSLTKLLLAEKFLSLPSWEHLRKSGVIYIPFWTEKGNYLTMHVVVEPSLLFPQSGSKIEERREFPEDVNACNTVMGSDLGQRQASLGKRQG